MVFDQPLNVYLIPGMSADTASFDSLEWNESQFSVKVLSWLEPIKDESLKAYTIRMGQTIDRSMPFALVGVSFGGVIAQELSLMNDPVKTIIISSIKSSAEKPLWMRIGYRWSLHKMLPFFMMRYMNYRPYQILPFVVEKRLRQYDHYLPVRSEGYLRWSAHQILQWEPSAQGKDPIHIHGDRDEMFPIKSIKNAQIIEGGSHIMIITHARQISKLLATILNN